MAGSSNVISSLEESFDKRIQLPEPTTVTNKDLVEQYHLTKHLQNLESEVIKREEAVNRLR